MDYRRLQSNNNVFSNGRHKSHNSSNGKTCNLSYSVSSSSSSSSAATLSQNVASRKRKQRSLSNLEEQEPELNLGPPSPKRQDRRLSCNQSDSGSVVSSVYPSSADDLVDEIYTHSSSECLSASGTEYEVADTPESPNSPHDAFAAPSPSPSILSSVSDVSESSQSPANYRSQDHESLKLLHHEKEKSRETSLQSPNVKSLDDYVSHYCMTPTEYESRMCPLPALSWANSGDVWSLMCKKDEQASCLRDASMLDNHPGLYPRMRAILLDWLIEVCEVYKLHRETYYLAVDYLDRYLSTQKKLQKTHLQLIGITCLFVAAKVEEIYPPKIGEFAYVTDGACREEDILQHEILLLQALDWNISPVTPMGWMGVYMQLNVTNRTPRELSVMPEYRRNNNVTCKESLRSSIGTNQSTQNSQKSFRNKYTTFKTKLNDQESSATPQKRSALDDTFIYPQFSGMEFVQTAQLLDLCSLDVGMANYPYSVIAAAAISHTFNKETALKVSGLEWNVVNHCAKWMEPFFRVVTEESKHLYLLEQNEQVLSKYGLGHICPNIISDDSHIIQTHTTSMTMFDRVSLLREQILSIGTKRKQEASPATGLICSEVLLTPPASSRKAINEDEQPNENNMDSISGVVDKVL